MYVLGGLLRTGWACARSSMSFGYNLELTRHIDSLAHA